MNNDKSLLPKVGILAIGLSGYWLQFQGMKEHLISKHHELIQRLEKYADVVSFGMVDSPELAAKAGMKFQEEGVDIVFCQSMTYSTSSNLIPAVKDLSVPIILLNVQEKIKLDLPNVNTLQDWLGHGCTCAGLPEMSAMLKRYDLTFDVITGYLEGDEILDNQIEAWCKAGSVRRKMRTMNIGLLGRQYLGMMDLYVDENAILKKFGMMTYFLMWEEVIENSEQVTATERTLYSEKIKNTFTIPDTVSQDDLDNIATMYGGFLKMVETYNLGILANHFERETVGKEIDLMAALNPSHTMLTSDGIACAVEGDIKGAIAMLIMKTIAGNANLTELYSMDFDDDICIIGHSGASDPLISNQKPVLKSTNVFHGKSGKGYTTQAIPKPGPITMLALTMESNGDFKLIVAEGICEEGELLNLGDTNCRVRFAIPMREFVNRWSIAGPSHHGVMSSGHSIETLKKVASILGLEMDIITQYTKNNLA
jgi:L-arabinose isomerase